jgi:hypothetical protein
LVDKNICRLEVTVNNPFHVRRLQGIRDFDGSVVVLTNFSGAAFDRDSVSAGKEKLQGRAIA